MDKEMSSRSLAAASQSRSSSSAATTTCMARRSFVLLVIAIHVASLVLVHTMILNRLSLTIQDCRTPPAKDQQQYRRDVKVTSDSKAAVAVAKPLVEPTSSSTIYNSSDPIVLAAVDQDSKEQKSRLVQPSEHQLLRAVMTAGKVIESSKEAETKSTKMQQQPLVREAKASETLEIVNNQNETQASFARTITDAPVCSPMRAMDVSYTLVAQCDDERVPLLAQHCERWRGPIAAAIYTERSADAIVAELVALNCTQEQLSISTLSADTFPEDSYPVNHLRNMAIRQVTTTHLVYMDVDFLPSTDLESTLRKRSIRNALSKDHKHALVIPAFEYKPDCQNCSSQEELLQRMPRTKRELMRLHHQDQASMFHDYWPIAHDSTDYDDWKRQVPGSLVSIPCIKSSHYEPYLVVRKCAELPPFQEAFTGYGYNKASFTMQLQAMRYKLSQIGGVFCTHFPHPVSKARQVFDQDKAAKTGRRLQIAELVKRYSQWLETTYGHESPRVPYCNAASQSSEATKAEVSNQKLQDTTTTDKALANDMPRFLEDSPALGECKDIKAEEVTYSLVTQCSDDRLWMMEQHCKRWTVNNSMPHMTLVVYTNDTLVEAKTKLLDLSCPVDKGMTVLTFPQVYEDKDYPVNSFRNEALAAVNTTHAVFIDVDFWASTDLFSTLNELSVRTKLAESVQNSMVVPAFELKSQCKPAKVDCPEKNLPLMPFARGSMMQTHLDSENITAFNAIYSPGGHGSTRYDLWAEQSPDQIHEIDCVTSNRYEPYLVVRVCRDLPPFQPIFTGYGKNKISWILHLRRLGWRFFQLGQAFVIHYPHKPSVAKTAWVKESPNSPTAMRNLNDQYFLQFRQWLVDSVPDRTKVSRCMVDGMDQTDDAGLI